MILGAHAIIYSRNPEADRAFLRDVLKLGHIDAGEGWLIFGLPPAEVGVHPSRKNNLHELYLMCDDVAAFTHRMKERSVACSRVQDQGWGQLTRVSLPGGGKLGVYEPRHARPKATPGPSSRHAGNRKAEFRKKYLAKFHWTEMNTTQGDAMLLRVLVESRGAKCGVEVGTNTGYGAINMGIGFERTGGRLTSVEISPKMVAASRRHLRKVGLDQVVKVVQGEALKVLLALKGEFDFVFIDAVKTDYLKYLQALEPKLKPGATVVADNVIQYAKQMADFLEYIQSSPCYDTAILRASMQKNDGMSVSYKIY